MIRNMSAKLKTILIADSDRRFVDVLAVQCQQIGLDVIRAHDARTTLKSIIENELDLICLDVDMPARDKFYVCEVLSNDESYSKIPLIALTTQKDRETIRRCGDMCAYLLTKSGDFSSRIQSVIHELVDVVPVQNRSPHDTSETTKPTN